MGILFSWMCKKDDAEHDEHYSADNIPIYIDWTQTPYNSPMDEQEIAKLFSEEYRSYNKYKM